MRRYCGEKVGRSRGILALPRVKQQVFPVARSKKVKNQQTNIVGIYEILHVPSNRRYIGSSQEMQDRL